MYVYMFYTLCLHTFLIYIIFFSSLPPEILTKILSYLCTFDVLRKVALVSTQFNELSKSPAAHRNVSVSFRANKNRAVKFLKSTTMIQRLHIFRPGKILIDYSVHWKMGVSKMIVMYGFENIVYVVTKCRKLNRSLNK